MATTRREFMKGGFMTAMLVAMGVNLDPVAEVIEMEFEGVEPALYAPQCFDWRDARPFDPRKSAIYVSFPQRGHIMTAAATVWEQRLPYETVTFDEYPSPIYRCGRPEIHYSWQAILIGNDWLLTKAGLLDACPHELWYLDPNGTVFTVAGCVPLDIEYHPMDRHTGGSVTVTGRADELQSMVPGA